MLTHAPWTAVRGLRHGFLDRRESAAESWEAALGVQLPIVVPRQVHGTRVADAIAGQSPEADAVVAAGPLLVGVVTADCVPVLLVERRERRAAAVHAGWRGTAGGILQAAVDHLRQQFGTDPRSLEAVIGPAIGGCCYEVGAEVREAFQAGSGSVIEGAWSERGARRYIDLRAAARFLLRAAGVVSVTTLGPCTACGAGYHSYRRDGARTGRQLSFVGWA